MGNITMKKMVHLRGIVNKIIITLSVPWRLIQLIIFFLNYFNMLVSIAILKENRKYKTSSR